jgi:anti-sigma regulatory factor (Ser/Thr protein kinase)
MNETITVKNRLGEVEAFQRKLEDLLRLEGFTDGLIHDLSLVAEEVLVNIVHYGYAGQEGSEREIVVRLLVDDQRKVLMEIRDDAVEFNPLEVEERDPEDDRLGGWGIPMLKTLTDRVEYAYENQQNVLRLERSERDS